MQQLKNAQKNAYMEASAGGEHDHVEASFMLIGIGASKSLFDRPQIVDLVCSAS